MPHHVINQSGQYCLSGNLIYQGDAITVNADDVDIDLSGYEISGPSKGGVQTNIQASGIKTDGYANISIRNGKISGFYRGVLLNSYTARDVIS